MRRFSFVSALTLLLALTLGTSANASVYNFDGKLYNVDYWAGSGANETLIVVDWNDTNGPYVTESHAFGYRWDGSAFLTDAIAAINLAGGLDLDDSGFGGGFVTIGTYNDGVDNHTNAGHSGWVWLADTTDHGVTYNQNGGGTDVEVLGNLKVEVININLTGVFTGDNATLPIVPEPTSAMLLLGSGGLMLLRRKARG